MWIRGRTGRLGAHRLAFFTVCCNIVCYYTRPEFCLQSSLIEQQSSLGVRAEDVGADGGNSLFVCGSAGSRSKNIALIEPIGHWKNPETQCSFPSLYFCCSTLSFMTVPSGKALNPTNSFDLRYLPLDWTLISVALDALA